MTALPIHTILFVVFSAVLLASGLMVVLSRNPVRAAWFLILAFFAASVLWLSMKAEFLGLVLVFVYVGAVMTLFVFVVMMLNIDFASLKGNLSKALPFAVLVLILFVVAVWLALDHANPQWATLSVGSHGANYSDVREIGLSLFNEHVFEFEVAAAILLIAILGAITLTFRGRRQNTRAQNVAEQLTARKQDRLKIIKGMK